MLSSLESSASSSSSWLAWLVLKNEVGRIKHFVIGVGLARMKPDKDDVPESRGLSDAAGGVYKVF